MEHVFLSVLELMEDFFLEVFFLEVLETIEEVDGSQESIRCQVYMPVSI